MTGTDSVPVERCPACGAPIVWALDIQIKRIAVDAEPSPDGTLRLLTRWDGAARALVPSKKLGFGLRTLHQPHVETCSKLGQLKRLMRL